MSDILLYESLFEPYGLPAKKGSTSHFELSSPKGAFITQNSWTGPPLECKAGGKPSTGRHLPPSFLALVLPL